MAEPRTVTVYIDYKSPYAMYADGILTCEPQICWVNSHHLQVGLSRG
jgi:hypothetical protein